MNYPWLYRNAYNLLYSVIFTVLVYLIYRLLSRQIDRLFNDSRLDDTGAFLLRRVFRWSSVLIVVALVFSQFGIKIDLIAGLLVLAGSTVIGFATMNTIGNAIAGLIIMFSRPFRIGDRLYLDGQFMDVEDIDLIFTRMKTPDNINIAIPNQKLLQTDIVDYGRERVVRRCHAITAGYGDSRETVEMALLEAASKVEELSDYSVPYVYITDFKNYAVEYTLFIYIDEPRKIQEIDAKVRREILIACERHGIDISTPTLIRNVNQS